MDVDILEHYSAWKWFEPELTKLLVLRADTADGGWGRSPARSVMHRVEREVIWTRSIDARVRVTYLGREVDERERYNDHYGFLGALDAGEECATGLVAHYGIPSDEERFAVEVLARATDHPSIGRVGVRHNRTWFAPVPGNAWFDHPSVAEGSSFDFKDFPYEYRCRLEGCEHVEKVVWSSLNGPEANAELRATFAAGVETNVKGWIHPKEVTAE